MLVLVNLVEMKIPAKITLKLRKQTSIKNVENRQKIKQTIRQTVNVRKTLSAKITQ